MCDNEKVFKRISDILKKTLLLDKRDKIVLDSNLNDLGMDSLDKMEILLELEDQFNIVINDNIFAKVKTVRDILDLVLKKGSE